MPTQNIDIIASLRRSVLFEQVPESTLIKVSNIVRHKTFHPGEHLIKKGEFGNSMYIICNGQVKVHDGDLVLNILSRGDTFGEMAALDGELRTASITSMTETQVLEINREELFKLMRHETEIAPALIHFLCQRGKNIISDITANSFKLRNFEHELDIGRNIQAGFLPDKLPKILNWDIAAYFKAAKEVAGDFYDVVELPQQNRIALVLGDVCGKGIGAALFMTLFRSLIRASLLNGEFTPQTSAAETAKPTTEIADFCDILLNSVTLTNNYIAHTHGSSCMFATLFVAILNPQNGILHYINCGHESPLLFRERQVIEELTPTGPAAGLIPDAEYKINELQLKPGDILAAFTDGTTDAISPDGERFSVARLTELISNSSGTATEVVANIVTTLDNFSGHQEQFDDITILYLKYNDTVGA